MFDYTTKDGILRIYEITEDGDWKMELRSGETYDLGPSLFAAMTTLSDLMQDGDNAESAKARPWIEYGQWEELGEQIEAEEWDYIDGFFGYAKGDEPVQTDDELFVRYRDEIEDWDWKELKRQAIQNYENSEDGSSGFTWVDSYYAICPSGKVYAFWTSNQTSWDERRDSIWWEAFEEVANDHGMWQTDGGESDHLYLGCDLPEGFLEERQKEQAELGKEARCEMCDDSATTVVNGHFLCGDCEELQ